MKRVMERVPHDSHKLYQSYTGHFSENYFPEILFFSKFEPPVNPSSYRYVLDDKILLSLFCQRVKNVSTPQIVGTYCNRVYFDAEHNVKTKEEFIEFLANCGEVIIKPMQDNFSGRGVRCVFIAVTDDGKLRNKVFTEF